MEATISRRSSTLSLSQYSDDSFSSDPSFSWADDSDALPPLPAGSSLLESLDPFSLTATAVDDWVPPRPNISWSQEMALRDAITYALTGETVTKKHSSPPAARRMTPPHLSAAPSYPNFRSSAASSRRSSPPRDVEGNWRRTEKGSSWSWNEAKGGYVLTSSPRFTRNGNSSSSNSKNWRN